MKVYENLPKEDLQLLLDAPVLVTILIGGSDGDLDEQEIAWGDKLTHIRQKSDNRFLADYYEDAAEDFATRLQNMVNILPEDTEERCRLISKKLERLNTIYEDLDINFVTELNKSLRSFAQQIADASGGILGFGAESYQEHQWIDLSMIKK